MPKPKRRADEPRRAARARPRAARAGADPERAAPRAVETPRPPESSAAPRGLEGAVNPIMSPPEPRPVAPPAIQSVTPDLAKIGDVARVCRVSRDTVDNWVRTGVIPAIRQGKIIRFDLAEVLAALKKKS